MPERLTGWPIRTGQGGFIPLILDECSQRHKQPGCGSIDNQRYPLSIGRSQRPQVERSRKNAAPLALCSVHLKAPASPCLDPGYSPALARWFQSLPVPMDPGQHLETRLKWPEIHRKSYEIALIKLY